jgi:hypothetical protein
MSARAANGRAACGRVRCAVTYPCQQRKRERRGRPPAIETPQERINSALVDRLSVVGNAEAAVGAPIRRIGVDVCAARLVEAVVSAARSAVIALIPSCESLLACRAGCWFGAIVSKVRASTDGRMWRRARPATFTGGSSAFGVATAMRYDTRLSELVLEDAGQAVYGGGAEDELEHDAGRRDR